jgi:hypothetical protein
MEIAFASADANPNAIPLASCLVGQLMDVRFDAVVIGGGFYGCNLARFLSNRWQRVVVVEKEPELLTRASYVNQARIHSGYHYPRSFLTALRSFFNFPRFVKDESISQTVQPSLFSDWSPYSNGAERVLGLF